MLKTAISAVIVCTIALIGGASSVAWVLASGYKFGAVRIGPWTSFPDEGTREADPYAQAEVAIGGMLSLGRAEGVGFIADRDSAGVPLQARCAYVISGLTPPGRFWTLRSEPLVDRTPRLDAPTIHSRHVLRGADDAVQIAVGHKPVPGNWLPVRTDGRMRLVLTIYDGSTTAGPVATEISMPGINRAGCDA